MNIDHKRQDNELEVSVEGRLDTNSAPELDKAITEWLDEDIETVVFDFTNLEYIASSGLRVLLSVLKKPAKSKRKVIIASPNDRIRDVLLNVGFDDIMEIRD